MSEKLTFDNNSNQILQKILYCFWSQTTAFIWDRIKLGGNQSSLFQKVYYEVFWRKSRRKTEKKINDVLSNVISKTLLASEYVLITTSIFICFLKR